MGYLLGGDIAFSPANLEKSVQTQDHTRLISDQI